MERNMYKQLIEWRLSVNRKPLVLYGARQVGKTYILKEFGRNEYDNLIYVNCYMEFQSLILTSRPQYFPITALCSSFTFKHAFSL